ncbi:hypothetical protein GW17_00050035 [Ensete ventricosum]|nr:hypothetical protein GW17_00050035 [Ensete ventricosum]
MNDTATERGDTSFSRASPAGRRGVASFLHGERRRRLVSCGEGGGASSNFTSSRARRRGVASSLCGETPISTVPPGSGRSTYRYPVGPIRTTRIGCCSSKQKTLLVSKC